MCWNNLLISWQELFANPDVKLFKTLRTSAFVLAFEEPLNVKIACLEQLALLQFYQLPHLQCFLLFYFKIVCSFCEYCFPLMWDSRAYSLMFELYCTLSTLPLCYYLLLQQPRKNNQSGFLIKTWTKFVLWPFNNFDSSYVLLIFSLKKCKKRTVNLHFLIKLLQKI